MAHDRVRLNPQTLAVRDAVDRALEATRFLVEGRGLTLSVTHIDPEALVVGDPTRLEQVFVNLVTNAAKYTEPGGHVAVTCTREGGDAVIRVRDDGIGIAPDLLPRIFDLFVQGQRGLDRSQGGLGIGLTVVRSLVGLHGGNVEAKSGGLGQGAEFIVRLPLSLEEWRRPRLDPKTGDAGRSSGTRILVVEDNSDAAEGLMMLIEAFGHDVRVATDGLAALELADEYVPDLMLVDIGLPGIDGYEVARRIRESAELSDVPLVALTGYGKDEDRERARAAGFDHHIVKPVDPAELRSVVKQFALPRSDAGRR